MWYSWSIRGQHGVLGVKTEGVEQIPDSPQILQFRYLLLLLLLLRMVEDFVCFVFENVEKVHRFLYKSDIISDFKNPDTLSIAAAVVMYRIQFQGGNPAHASLKVKCIALSRTLFPVDV